MDIQVPSAMASLTVDGGTDGYVTVASNAAFYPGAEAWLRSDTVDGVHCIITDLVSTNKIGLRFVPERGETGPSYGRNSCSAYHVANNAKIYMPKQLVVVDPAFNKKTSI